MTPSTTLAWTYTSPPYPTTLSLLSIPLPTLPSRGLLIRTRAAALNPVDIQLQNLPLFNLPFLSFPKIPGADFSGTVLAAGPGAGWTAGDEVCGAAVDVRGWGALADVIFVDLDRAKVVLARRPQGLSWEKAAGLGVVWMTAQTAVRGVEGWMGRGGEQPKLVVLGGSSATGMYTTHLARQRGWRVLATCSGRNTALVQDMGAHEVVDYTAQDVPAEVSRFAPGAIIDCVGGTECIGLAERYLSIVGDKTSRASMGGRFLYLTSPAMVWRWAVGSLGWGKSYDCIVYENVQEWFDEIQNLDAEKVLVDSTFAFEDLLSAYERLNTGRARGKVVITFPE